MLRGTGWIWTAALTAGCGGATASGTSDGDASTANRVEASTDAAGPDSSDGVSVDAGAPDTGTSGPEAGVDASADGGIVIAGRIPKNHRPGGACSATRGAGDVISCTPTTYTQCTSDAQCTAGTNGRCLASSSGPLPPLPCGAACSYDECAVDSDCGSHIPCECRPSASDNSPNYCVSGSACATDSDCGSGGYCSPSTSSTCLAITYFCHTPQDACLDDADCARGICVFDSALAHWTCGSCDVPP